MASIIDRLPSFALPFVTRSLRRGRGRRYVALSLGLALLTLLSCLWIGLGQGRGARDARMSIGVEQAIYWRERQEFVVIRQVEFAHIPLTDRREDLIADARETLIAAATTLPEDPRHHELHARARALVERQGLGWQRELEFRWTTPSEVRRLGRILEREGVPGTVDYTPMVGLPETVSLLGMVTGVLLLLLATVVAPLLVAIQQAVERHENSLQPLTGTSLSARALAVGMACGPLAIVAIFAAPLAVLFVAAALASGQLAALLVLPVAIGIAIGMVFGAQVLAHLLGARVPAVLITVGLLGLLGLVGLASAVIGSQLTIQTDMPSLPGVLPNSGAFALLGFEFGDPWRAAAVYTDWHRFWEQEPVEFADVLVPTLVGTVGAALLGLLALQALARHIEGRSVLLESRQALLGAVVCIVMASVAISTYGGGEPDHQAFGLPMLALPLLLLIMARLPVGEVPPAMRRIPLARLLGEFAGWTLLYMIVSAALDDTLAGFHPITLLGVAWCVLVLVLLGVRLAATSTKLLGYFWAAICLGLLPSIYTFATDSSFEGRAGSGPGDLPLLAMIFVAIVVWVPLSLFRHLRRNVARLS